MFGVFLDDTHGYAVLEQGQSGDEPSRAGTDLQTGSTIQ